MPIGTLALLKARIASELARSDLTTQIADAINDAIAYYQTEMFRFSSTNPITPTTFNTVNGEYRYGPGTIPFLSSLMHVAFLNVTIGATLQEVQRVTPEEVYLAQQIGTTGGQPETWALEGETLIFYPTPNQAYPITLVSGNLAYPAPASDGETGNRWMLDGEPLIRSYAKYQIATHVTRNTALARAMSPDPHEDGLPDGEAYRAFKKMKGEANRLMGTGRIRPMRW